MDRPPREGPRKALKGAVEAAGQGFERLRGARTHVRGDVVEERPKGGGVLGLADSAERSASGRAYAGDPVTENEGERVAGLAEFALQADLGGHFAYAPSLVGQGGHDRAGDGRIPGVQQCAGGPGAKPVAVVARTPVEHRLRVRAAGDEEAGVGIGTEENRTAEPGDRGRAAVDADRLADALSG